MTMHAIRIHGRGGQGVVTSAELLSAAGFAEGRHAQAFPTFGSERTGAPVVSFCRIADAPIRSHEPIAEPDTVIVQDPTLLHGLDVLSGLRDGGLVIVNSSHPRDELLEDEPLSRLDGERVLAVPATVLAREHLGRPLPGAALLGAFAAASGIVSLAALGVAIHERFPGAAGDGNVAAADAAFALIAEVTRA